MLGLIIALLSRTKAARVSALALMMVSATSAWPVYQYGEAGYDRVRSMVDEAGDKWLDEHLRRGERLIYVFYAVAALSAVAMFYISRDRLTAIVCEQCPLAGLGV